MNVIVSEGPGSLEVTLMFDSAELPEDFMEWWASEGFTIFETWRFGG